MKNKKLISFLLAFLILFSALPINVFAGDEGDIKIVLTDGISTIDMTKNVGDTFEIPENSFIPPEGKFITSIKNKDGKEINPMEVLTKDDEFTIEYGDKIETTFSIVGNKNFNDKLGYGDQIAPPRKIEITYQDLLEHRDKYNVDNKKYAVVSDVFIKALESDPKLSPELTDDLKDDIESNYISEMFGLGEFKQGPMSGWMYYINQYYSNLGLGAAGVFNNDYIRWYSVDNFMLNNYTWFTELEKTVREGEEFKVHLLYRTRDGKALNYEGATIIIDGEDYEIDGKPVKTDVNGEATVVIKNPGTHYISARHMIEDEPTLHKITMPYMSLVAKEKIKVPDEWIESKANSIANEYDKTENLNDWWKIIELSKYHQVKGDFTENTVNEKSLEYLKNVTIDKNIGKAKTDINTLTKSVLAVRAAGMDPENYYGNNLVELLANAEVIRPYAYEYGPALNALYSDNYKNSPSLNKAIDFHISKLLEIQEEDGLWQSKYGMDSTGFALYALAPFYNDSTRPEVKTALDKAIEAIGKKLLDNADFNDGDGNNNSLAMVLGGLTSINPELVIKEDLTRNGKTMFDALKDYEIDYGFKWQKNENSPNSMATEQSFRALLNYLSMNSNNGNVFDFRNAPKRVVQEEIEVDKTKLEEAIVNANNKSKDVIISTDGSNVEKDKKWVTEEIQKALDEAIKSANTIKDKADATQEEVNNATDALNRAIENYKPAEGTKEDKPVPSEVDKTKLEKAIVNANNKSKDVIISTDGSNVEKDKKWVTEEIQKALDEAIKSANTIKDKADATQEEVNNATDALNRAIENYKPAEGTKEDKPVPSEVDKTKLEAKVIYLEKLINSYYVSKDGKDVPKNKLWITPEMKVQLLESITKAKEVLANNELTISDINKAFSELTKSIDKYNKPEFGKSEEKPVVPIYPRPTRPERDRYDLGYKNSAPFLPGVGFVKPGYSPIAETRPTVTTKPTTKTKPVENKVIPLFTDITGHWAEQAINSVVEKDYFKGTGVDTFSPNRKITRAELVTVLGRIAGVNPKDYSNTTMGDVEKGSYYEGYVNWALEKGIVNGIGENKFDPNSEATREEVATIISRYLDMIGKNTNTKSELSYKDSIEISSWAKDAVVKLTELGVFKGQDGNRFNANNPITRAEIAQVIYNMDNAKLIK